VAVDGLRSIASRRGTIDLRGHHSSRPQPLRVPFRQDHAMEKRPPPSGCPPPQREALAADDAGVSDLAAALGVKTAFGRAPAPQPSSRSFRSHQLRLGLRQSYRRSGWEGALQIAPVGRRAGLELPLPRERSFWRSISPDSAPGPPRSRSPRPSSPPGPREPAGVVEEKDFRAGDVFSPGPEPGPTSSEAPECPGRASGEALVLRLDEGADVRSARADLGEVLSQLPTTASESGAMRSWRLPGCFLPYGCCPAEDPARTSRGPRSTARRRRRRQTQRADVIRQHPVRDAAGPGS
jgi:hypothetical protein